MESVVSAGRFVVYLEAEIFPPILADASVEVRLRNFTFKFPANTIQIKTNEFYVLALGAVGSVVIKMH